MRSYAALVLALVGSCKTEPAASGGSAAGSAAAPKKPAQSVVFVVESLCSNGFPATTTKVPMSRFHVGSGIDPVPVVKAGTFTCTARDPLQDGQGVRVDCARETDELGIDLRCATHFGNENADWFRVSHGTTGDSCDASKISYWCE